MGTKLGPGTNQAFPVYMVCGHGGVGCPSTLQEAQMTQDEGQALAGPRRRFCPQPARRGGKNTWAPLPREPGFRGSCLLAASRVLIGQGAQTLTPPVTERARSGGALWP